MFCVLSTGGRRHWVFEVWKRAVARAGWCHLPPHEDAVSSWLWCYTFPLWNANDTEEDLQQMQPDSQHNTSWSQHLFVTLIMDKYAKYLGWIMGRTENADLFWLSFVSCTPLTHQLLPCRFSTSFLSVSHAFYSVEDKHRVATLAHIPKFLPEITIGAHEYDEKFYAYKSVCRDKTFILTCWSGLFPLLHVIPHFHY